MQHARKKERKNKKEYEEAKECKFWNKDKIKTINLQIKKYEKEKYPKKNGLIQGRFILRKHNNQKVKLLMN